MAVCPTGQDLIPADVIKHAHHFDTLARTTDPLKVAAIIAKLGQAGIVDIHVGMSSYSPKAFLKLAIDQGGPPYGTRLTVLREPEPELGGKGNKMAPKGLLTKESPSATTGGAHVLDDVAGLVSAIVAVTNVVDDVNDIIMPGAFQDTLAKRLPKGVDAHQWEMPVARTLAAEELMPGDPRLPDKLRMLNAGGLLVLAEFNLQTQKGRESYEDVKFFGDGQEWSIGYAVPPGG